MSFKFKTASGGIALKPSCGELRILQWGILWPKDGKDGIPSFLLENKRMRRHFNVAFSKSIHSSAKNLQWILRESSMNSQSVWLRFLFVIRTLYRRSGRLAVCPQYAFSLTSVHLQYVHLALSITKSSITLSIWNSTCFILFRSVWSMYVAIN